MVLKQKIKKIKADEFSYFYVKRNAEMHFFYTGIKKEVFALIMKYSNLPKVTKLLTPEDHILLVLMRLRLGLKIKDLAYRFKISHSVASKFFRKLIPKLTTFMLENVFSWPEKEAL